MTVRELATQLKLEVCCGAAGLDKEIKGGYTSPDFVTTKTAIL